MKTPHIALSLAVLTLILAAIGLNRWLIDGLSGEFWGLLFHEDTRYAPGYSDAAWRRLHIGESKQAAIHDLGEPIDVWTNDDNAVIMRWSISPGDTHYRVRALVIRDECVAEKHAEFYVD